MTPIFSGSRSIEQLRVSKKLFPGSTAKWLLSMNFDRFGALAQDLMYSLRVQYPQIQKPVLFSKTFPKGIVLLTRLGDRLESLCPSRYCWQILRMILGSLEYQVGG
jgi:hypothetical protein